MLVRSWRRCWRWRRRRWVWSWAWCWNRRRGRRRRWIWHRCRTWRWGRSRSRNRRCRARVWHRSRGWCLWLFRRWHSVPYCIYWGCFLLSGNACIGYRITERARSDQCCCYNSYLFHKSEFWCLTLCVLDAG